MTTEPKQATESHAGRVFIAHAGKSKDVLASLREALSATGLDTGATSVEGSDVGVFLWDDGFFDDQKAGASLFMSMNAKVKETLGRCNVFVAVTEEAPVLLPGLLGELTVYRLPKDQDLLVRDAAKRAEHAQ